MTLRSRAVHVLFGALLLTCAVAAPSASRADSPGRSEVTRALVKVFTVANPYNWYNPWQRGGTESVSGSGVVVGPGRILTNAHVVDDAVSVEVKPNGDSKRFAAKVLHVDHTCDLALLMVDDDTFANQVGSLELSEMPAAQDAIEVFGYPLGGENLSITAGVVSRIEFSMYAHSLETLLTVLIDAAMNSGNSGGPVVSGGKIVGIATATLEDAENVGYMVPPPVIQHFLDDAADGNVDGFPSLGIVIQNLESEAHRRRLGLADRQGGILVVGVNHGGAAWNHLEVGDVVLELDGIPIASDATVESPYGTRLDFRYRPPLKQVGDSVALKILRGGREKNVSFPLNAAPRLVRPFNAFDRPGYRVFGGLIFMPLDMDYLKLFEEIPSDLMYYAMYRNLRTPERDEVILLSRVLPHEITRGYHDMEDYIVASVQGEKPRNFMHFNEILDQAKGPWLEIVTEIGHRVVLDIDEARQANAEILELFGIPHDRFPSAAAPAKGAAR